MSIKVKDVLERILAQVSTGPLPELGLEIRSGAALRDPSRNAVLGVIPLAPRGPAELSSNLHFWAIGLRAFMRARGDEHGFAGLAEHGLCRPIAGEVLDARVERLLALASERPAFSMPEPVIGAYEMFADANRWSLLLEARSGFAALYWESDAILPASRTLLRLLWRHARRELGASSGETWIVAQHDSDLFEPADLSYAWRIGSGVVEPLDTGTLEDAPRLRFVLENQSHRIRFACSSPTGEMDFGDHLISGEGADIAFEGLRAAV